ncbi:MAG: BLUF domain-containing protein [Leeuwenhoekiella sp.]
MIHSIIYLSAANTTLGHENLKDLLKQTLYNNNARNITGFLLYKNQYFLQLLEGNKKDLRSLYKKITADSRHSNVIKLVDQTTQERTFASYLSGFEIFDNSHCEELLKSRIANISTFPSPDIRKKAYIISGILNSM